MENELDLYTTDEDTENMEIRCLKCQKYFVKKDLIAGYCENCASDHEKRCQECGKPISKLNYFKFMGYCKMCHADWIKPTAYKFNNGVETYPNTGV